MGTQSRAANISFKTVPGLIIVGSCRLMGICGHPRRIRLCAVALHLEDAAEDMPAAAVADGDAQG